MQVVWKEMRQPENGEMRLGRKRNKELLFDEPICRAGIETQTQRADLRTQWGRRGWHGRMHSHQSPLQHRSSEASSPQRSAFFTVQLSHSYVTTGKTTALTRRTFVSKEMSLLFYVLSRLAIGFLSRSKCLLISWLQSRPAVIWGSKKIKSATVSIVSLFAMK